MWNGDDNDDMLWLLLTTTFLFTSCCFGFLLLNPSRPPSLLNFHGMHIRHSLATFHHTIKSRLIHSRSRTLFNAMNSINHATDIPTTRALITSTSPTTIASAAARLRSGHLVSFPTETVYGLGCNALDPIAIQKVFLAKERPLTDPLILHVNEPSEAWSLWQAFSSSSEENTKEYHLLTLLTQAFWPGPLTLVAKAASHIPTIVMANTGYVACRSPSHPIARALIQEAQVPIAAPSANKFGHVSPTTAQHVWDDLSMEDVWILDPTLEDRKEEGPTNQTIQDATVCNVGVESTVAKIEMNEDGTRGRILILRHGAISSRDIQSCLYVAQMDADFDVLDNMMQSTPAHVSHVAPGQCIRHYSPHVPSFMVDNTLVDSSILDIEDIKVLQRSVVLDFGSQLILWKDHALAYRDLSVQGDANVAASRVFSFLRWSEQVSGAQQVFFPKLTSPESPPPLLQALTDRLTRAASGNVISSLKEMK